MQFTMAGDINAFNDETISTFRGRLLAVLAATIDCGVTETEFVHVAFTVIGLVAHSFDWSFFAVAGSGTEKFAASAAA
jgi:hypothetical protein